MVWPGRGESRGGSVPVLWTAGRPFPSCCVKCTRQAVLLMAAAARRERVISSQGMPLEPGCIFCLRSGVCLFVVMYSSGSELSRTQVYRASAYALHKDLCDIQYWAAQITTTFCFLSSHSVEDWWQWSLASFSLPMGEATPLTVGGQPSQGKRGDQQGPCSFLFSVLSPKQAPGCRRGCAGECIMFENTCDYCGKISLAREFQE